MTKEAFENSITNGMGNLHEMFDMQIKLQRRIYYGEPILPSMQPGLLPMTITGIVEELGEILHAQSSWKNWRVSTPVDKVNLDEEVADLWHFVINLTMQLGYSAEETYRCFIAKNIINHERQDAKNKED